MLINYLTCCFIGHRKIEYTVELEQKLIELIENLIIEFNVGVFLFGSRSEFNDLCYKVVTKLKEKYPYIKRIYIRAEYNYDDSTMSYLLTKYEDTYFPKEIENAGKCSYVERNQIMIDKSKYCIFYYKEDYTIPTRSGTKLALTYARQKKKDIIIVNKEIMN